MCVSSLFEKGFEIDETKGMCLLKGNIKKITIKDNLKLLTLVGKLHYK